MSFRWVSAEKCRVKTNHFQLCISTMAKNFTTGNTPSAANQIGMARVSFFVYCWRPK